MGCGASKEAQKKKGPAPSDPALATADPSAASEAYQVSGAGEAATNGTYRQDGSYDGVPVYVHESGAFRILRYRFQNTGGAYWFLTRWDLTGKTYSQQDMYRTGRSEAPRPPAKWYDVVTLDGKRPSVFGKTAPTVRLRGAIAADIGSAVATTAHECRYVVTGAGESHVNGLYLKSGLYDGVPQYVNEHGVTLLRYRFRKTNKAYWFFCERNKDGIDKLDRDLYRRPSPTEEAFPPSEWLAAPALKSLVGKLPTPSISPQGVADEAEEEEEDKLDGTQNVDMSFPSYWKSTGSSFTMQVTPGKAAWASIERLLKDSFTDKRTRDRKGRPMPTSLALRNLLRVENSSMWNRYAAKRAHLRRVECPSLEALYGGAPVLTAWEGQGLVPAVNEFYLWHGTKPSSAMNIVSEGFQITRAGKSHGAMFGNGAYFAEAASKSDEYAEDENAGLYAGLFAMLLCRVCCGRIHRVLKAEPDGIMRMVEAGACNSVLGDREAAVGTYREFVVFDASQVYPEYALVYAREYEEELQED